jgi:hypothetical protein
MARYILLRLRLAASEDGFKQLWNVMEGGFGLFVALFQKCSQGLKPAIHLVTGPDNKVGLLNKNVHC